MTGGGCATTDWTKEIFGDVRFNAVFFMLGIVCIGIGFVCSVATSVLPYVQGGPVAGAANEFALLTTVAAALTGVGFVALGLGAIVFAQNYEPIKQEANLVALAGFPYGIFVIAQYMARLQAGGTNDFFSYAVARSPDGTATLIVWMPESYSTLGPFLVLGSFAAAVCMYGLSLFLANMKIVKQVGGLTLGLAKVVGILMLAGPALMLSGWSSFTADNAGTDWFGLPFILYFVGYTILAFGVPVLGAIVAFRVGAIFWDAAKTVRYLSDFRKRATAVAERRAATQVDNRPWWEKLAEEGGDEK